MYPTAILEDTRNQPGKHKNVHKFCADNSIRIVRTKILVGDYALPTSQAVCVDTKYGLQEVYGNLVQDHERFRRECVLANEIGIRLIVLVEENGIGALENVGAWKNPRYERYVFLKMAHEQGRYLGTKLPARAPIDSTRLQRMMETMSDKYGVEWMFCDKNKTGETLLHILSRGDG